ncbi:hypothetical protein CAAN1_13S01926 [[Candida] anglica]|uniref:Ubiquitin ligase-binding protein BUL1 n=1 Tax=[Candida] anglica TaxID=148631 RepID=A0ABP0EG37_9ASCO
MPTFDSDSSGSTTSTESHSRIGSMKPESNNASSSQPSSTDILPLSSPDYEEYDYFSPKQNTKKPEVPLWNILPSYHMYTSTVSKSLRVTHDDLNDTAFEPPTYDDLATLSSCQSGRASGSSSTPGTIGASYEELESLPQSVDAQNPNLIIADESSNLWQCTILDNIHTLNNLSDSDNVYAKALKIDVFFTEEIGEMGKEPVFIDPSNYEYKQGDLINGYFLVDNQSDKEISFDMFYVLFEGNFKVSSNVFGTNGKETFVTKKFLEMFDFSASWHYGYINRLLSEYTNPYTCPDSVDPIDNTQLSFGAERTIKPFIKHKRFFTFKIPDKLLDSSCQHNLSSHTETPPSIGLASRDQLKNLHNSNFVKTSATTNDGRLKDFSFFNTCINYSVDARFIGKASMYGVLPDRNQDEATLVNTTGDEFIILRDTHQSIRIIEETKISNDLELKAAQRVSKDLFDNFKARVDDEVTRGEELLAAKLSKTSSKEPSFLSSIISPIGSNSANSSSLNSNTFNSRTYSENTIASTIAKELAKCQQMYKPSQSRRKSKAESLENSEHDYYKIFYPIQKRSITGTAKFLGTLVACTPKVHYSILYIPPPSYRTDEVDSSSWNIDVPIDLEYVIPGANSASKNLKLPEIKSFGAELIALTIKSEIGSIPIEFNHDMLFDNNQSMEKTHKSAYEYETDFFEDHVIKPLKEKTKKLQSISQQLGPGVFRMDLNLVEDLKTLCKLKTKHMNLVIDQVKLKSINNNKEIPSSEIPWEVKYKPSNAESPTTYKKSFTVSIDLTSGRLKSGETMSKLKAYDNYNLIPDFQMCQMTRFYYIKVLIALQKGETIVVNVPLEVKK